ncbi:hypothetical protein [Candidatus Palauibacter sp.]
MSRKVETPRGPPATMRRIVASSMIPGPLGIAETSPMAVAP